ncbi:hypothetical protein BEWA_028510 [Theileria equi strain WA]|uniref:Signal peptide containing protein n=1 Tax=Theileria equi strain WA TaxID=1537102 RepID=L0AYB5_THEEQ|nr:hypothetical protein BEWA_028510 [Theileria equi strain WA]AFZ80001.1 hypothetical protein BEWA_028510 [Theileria equi strain WA]|eukprot:XP_004829667.1 hypothetical protein BEWA_028510 [Theileria equi strain WA]
MEILQKVLIGSLIAIILTSIILPIVMFSLSDSTDKVVRNPLELDISVEPPKTIWTKKYHLPYEATEYAINDIVKENFRIGTVRDGKEVLVENGVDADKTVIFIKYDDGTRYILVHSVDLANEKSASGNEGKGGVSNPKTELLEFAKKQGEAAYSRVERRPIEVDLMKEAPPSVTVSKIDSRHFIYRVGADEFFSLHIGTIKYGEHLVEENEEGTSQKYVIVDKNGTYPKIKTFVSKRNGQSIERLYEFTDGNFKRLSEKLKEFSFTGLY